MPRDGRSPVWTAPRAWRLRRLAPDRAIRPRCPTRGRRLSRRHRRRRSGRSDSAPRENGRQRRRSWWCRPAWSSSAGSSHPASWCIGDWPRCRALHHSSWECCNNLGCCDVVVATSSGRAPSAPGWEEPRAAPSSGRTGGSSAGGGSRAKPSPSLATRS
eukprot:34596-Prorocentrum_minimum.AAC.5